MDRCLIDIETKSPLDIRKTSGYGYARECEIILVSFAWNDEPVRQIDFTDPNRDPLEVLTLLKILTDPNVIKMAHNAAFEWAVFNACGYETPIDQWQDTMAHAMYLSYPASLEAAGKALGLSEDKLKMSEGKTLIRYFCQPTKDGTYRSPSVNPERWEIFKEYNRRDVETEREIQRRLDRFPMPEGEIERWRNDILMNNYGVPIDLQLLRGALYMIAESEAELMAEAKALTGLDNPNSTQQLIPWLTSHECKVTNLTKDTVADALSGDLDANVRRVLEIRQELSKTSVKKYGAIDDALCIDGRVRGISMYYGATRSGRWCLTGDHEVMTPSGWVRLDAWSGGDILVWNKDLEMFSFQKSTPVSFSYSGDMVRYESKRCDQIATPEHKMPVLNKDGSWEVKTVGEIGRRRVTIPFTGRRTINYPLDNYELRVLIMTQAGGHYTREGHLRFRFKKHRKIERCKMLLRRAGISFAFHEYSDASVVTVPRTQLPLWLRTFRDKTFGYWLLDENPAVLFDELAMWDGYRVTDNSVQYSTTNKQNADVIQMCAVCGGYSVNVRVKERINKNWSTAYVVDIWTKPGKGTIITERQITTIQHDGRVYCAETPTGFFVTRRNGKVWVTGNSGRLIQLQNLTKHHIGTLDEARALVSAGEYSATKMVYGNIYSLLSQIVRTVLVPSDGRKFVVADFSAIEARVIAWLAGEQWVNEVFATHGRIYEATAAQMFHVPIETIVKGHENYDLRQKGKVATLALGYQGGPAAMVAMGALNMGLTEAELPDIVSKWRSANPHIVSLWRDMEDAAVSVVQYGGSKDVRGGLVQLALEVDVLYGLSFMTMRLPSGRKLYYAKPFLKENRFGKMSVHHYGVGTTKKWEEQNTYSGKLTENCIQAIARDCLAVTLDRVKANGWDVVFHVHDEVVIDAPMDLTVDTVCDLMSEPISWAPGLVLKAAGFESPYYKKD